jgi:hypothetical protein
MSSKYTILDEGINIAKEGNLSKLKNFIKNPDVDNNTLSHMFHQSITNGHLECVIYLESKGCKLPAHSVDIGHILSGNLDMIKYFISKGYDPTLNDSKALNYAACYRCELLNVNRVEIVKYLISLGCNIRNNSSIPSYYDDKGREMQIYMDLLSLGLNHHMEKNGLLIECITLENFQITKLLIDYGYDIVADEFLLKKCIELSFYYDGELSPYLCAILPRKCTQNIFIEFCDPEDKTYNFILQSINDKRNLYKNNFLKKILRPTSFHTQLVLIE